MTRIPDARIPVVFGSAMAADGDTALLIEGEGPVATLAAVARFTLPSGTGRHPAGCACCVPRGPVAAALAALFLGRARGALPFFRRVLVVAGPQGRDAVRAALADDPLVAARFRPDGDQAGPDQEGSEVSPAPNARCM